MSKIIMKLPRYVSRFERASGKVDFYFHVPKAQRPDGWPGSTRLPKEGRDRTRTGDSAEIAAVVSDATDLNASLDALRAANSAQDAQKHVPGSLPDLMDKWRSSREWRALKPKTVRFYEQGWTHIEKWSTKNRHPNITTISWPVIFKLVSVYNDRPGVSRQVRGVLQSLCRIAFDAGMIERDPWEGQKRRKWHRGKRAEMQVVTYADVLEMAALCDKAGHPSMGTAAIVAFDIMQYPADLVEMRFGTHYSAANGVFTFDRGKTGVPATVRASAATRARIGDADRIYLFVYEGTKRPYSVDLFRRIWRKCMKGSRFDGFQFKWLRHSGVAECDNAGVDERAIDAMGAWAPGGKAVRDLHYRQHNASLAESGMATREQFRKVQE